MTCEEMLCLMTSIEAKVQGFRKFLLQNLPVTGFLKEPAPSEDYKLEAKIVWSYPGDGFGQFFIVLTDAHVYIDTEGLDMVKVHEIFERIEPSPALQQILRGAPIITDQDTEPMKHRLYSRVMDRWCSSGCEICHPSP